MNITVLLILIYQKIMVTRFGHMWSSSDNQTLKKNRQIITWYILSDCDHIWSKFLAKLYKKLISVITFCWSWKVSFIKRMIRWAEDVTTTKWLRNVHKSLVTKHEVKWPTTRNKEGGRLIQNLILKKEVTRMWLEFFWIRRYVIGRFV